MLISSSIDIFGTLSVSMFNTLTVPASMISKILSQMFLRLFGIYFKLQGLIKALFMKTFDPVSLNILQCFIQNKITPFVFECICRVTHIRKGQSQK